MSFVRHPQVRLAVACVLLIGWAAVGPQTAAEPQPPQPSATATLIPATPLEWETAADSNSPAVWRQDGVSRELTLFTSVAGQPTRHVGVSIAHLREHQEVTFNPAPSEGAWMEAVLSAEDGTLYGYYHNEITTEACEGSGKTLPRIGAARSSDGGVTWEDLGTILAAPPDTYDCDSANYFFVGGLGDFTVLLNDAHTEAYIYYSSYVRDVAHQGVAVARLPWADRDNPVGKVDVWRDDVWLPPSETIDEETGRSRWIYPEPTPIYPAALSFHTSKTVDAFWGPSIHWNTYLQQWVMLLNHAQDSEFGQEGIYIAFAPVLDNPAAWSAPQRILTGGRWYPQVIGHELGVGTDKVAGETARFFMGGQSVYEILFGLVETPERRR